VDASASNGFRRRGPRALVGAAGVMVELWIAAAAVLLWHAASSQLVQQCALAVVAGCGISTLLFNANPLTRFDGYYVLCDLLDLPNLSSRGNRMVAYLFDRMLSGSREEPAPEESRREAIAVTVYALLSWGYQALMAYGLAYWLYDTQPRLSLAIGVLSAVMLLKRPVGHALGYLLLDFRLTGRRLRATLTIGALSTALGLLLFVVPVPSFTVQQGVVWVPGESILRVDVDGDLKEMKAGEGDRVQAGQLIAVLDNQELRSQRSSAWAQLQVLESRYFDSLLNEPLDAHKLGLERDAVQAQLARLDRQLASLEIRARATGTLVAHRDNVQPDHYFAHGQEIGYVVPEQPRLLVKVALTEAQAAMVRGATRDVSVQLDAGRRAPQPARLERETPNAVRELPNAALGSAHGGPVPTDPADVNGLRTLAPVDVVDVVVDGLPSPALGARAWVRFDHRLEPLGLQWYRALTQAFLSRLGRRS
jgi:putative peptide zinc metalloprotease protein